LAAIKIRLACFLGGFPKTVQDINCIGKLRDVNDTERPSGVPNSYLLYTDADSWHRLPIVRLVTLLYSIDLMTCFVPR